MNVVQRQPKLILIVDDEMLLREMIAEVFLDEGFRVLQASNAAEALNFLEAHDDIRLLFSDIQMPGKIDGLGLLEIVHQRWPNILLVVTSGRLRPPAKDLPDDACFIQKPFNQSDMLRQVDNLFSKHPLSGF